MRTMTWNEYWNQGENPERMPKVEITNDEVAFARPCGMNGEVSIFMEYPNGHIVEYIRKRNGYILWTTDDDGNPKNRSCFFIDDVQMENIYEALAEVTFRVGM